MAAAQGQFADLRFISPRTALYLGYPWKTIAQPSISATGRAGSGRAYCPRRPQGPTGVQTTHGGCREIQKPRPTQTLTAAVRSSGQIQGARRAIGTTARRAAARPKAHGRKGRSSRQETLVLLARILLGTFAVELCLLALAAPVELGVLALGLGAPRDKRSMRRRACSFFAPSLFRAGSTAAIIKDMQLFRRDVKTKI